MFSGLIIIVVSAWAGADLDLSIDGCWGRPICLCVLAATDRTQFPLRQSWAELPLIRAADHFGPSSNYRSTRIQYTKRRECSEWFSFFCFQFVPFLFLNSLFPCFQVSDFCTAPHVKAICALRKSFHSAFKIFPIAFAEQWRHDEVFIQCTP